MSHTASQKIPPNASPPDGAPQFPWPVVPNRRYRVEVCRWYHGSTERRNAWHWIYEIHIGVEQSEFMGRVAGVSFQATRQREDAITGCRSHVEPEGDFDGVVVSDAELHAKVPPPRLVEFFNGVVEKVRRRAEKQKAAYDRATGYGGDW